MPTGGKRSSPLVDTSVAVALAVADHEHHRTTVQAVGDRRLGLAGHAAFETYSVLSRLPAPARRSPSVIAELLAANFPGTRYLSPPAAADLLAQLATAGVAGGSVYDALVGATAVEHRTTLLTRDRRAVDTYTILGADVDVLG